MRSDEPPSGQAMASQGARSQGDRPDGVPALIEASDLLCTQNMDTNTIRVALSVAAAATLLSLAPRESFAQG